VYLFACSLDRRPARLSFSLPPSFLLGFLTAYLTTVSIPSTLTTLCFHSNPTPPASAPSSLETKHQRSTALDHPTPPKSKRGIHSRFDFSSTSDASQHRECVCFLLPSVFDAVLPFLRRTLFQDPGGSVSNAVRSATNSFASLSGGRSIHPTILRVFTSSLIHTLSVRPNYAARIHLESRQSIANPRSDIRHP
jgi:hypothetical protein